MIVCEAILELAFGRRAWVAIRKLNLHLVHSGIEIRVRAASEPQRPLFHLFHTFRVDCWAEMDDAFVQFAFLFSILDVFLLVFDLLESEG